MTSPAVNLFGIQSISTVLEIIGTVSLVSLDRSPHLGEANLGYSFVDGTA